MIGKLDLDPTFIDQAQFFPKFDEIENVHKSEEICSAMLHESHRDLLTIFVVKQDLFCQGIVR